MELFKKLNREGVTIIQVTHSEAQRWLWNSEFVASSATAGWK